jgi:probable addiction module antidote protein
VDLDIKPYDAAEYLDSDEMIVAYLKEEFNSNEPRYMAKALASVARAKGGFTRLSASIGMSEAELQRAADFENPDLEAIRRAMRALGVPTSDSVAA